MVHGVICPCQICQGRVWKTVICFEHLQGKSGLHDLVNNQMALHLRYFNTRKDKEHKCQISPHNRDLHVFDWYFLHKTQWPEAKKPHHVFKCSNLGLEHNWYNFDYNSIFQLNFFNQSYLCSCNQCGTGVKRLSYNIAGYGWKKQWIVGLVKLHCA